MGLECSHGAFRGSYSTFNRLRQAVCFAAGGGSFPPHLVRDANGVVCDGEGLPSIDRDLNEELIYFGDGYSNVTHPGLHAFLTHSDCEGEFSPELCAVIAADLSPLLLRIPGDMAAILQRFINGLRRAEKNGEPLTFG